MDEGVQLVQLVGCVAQKHSAKRTVRRCCMLHGFTAYVTWLDYSKECVRHGGKRKSRVHASRPSSLHPPIPSPICPAHGVHSSLWTAAQQHCFCFLFVFTFLVSFLMGFFFWGGGMCDDSLMSFLSTRRCIQVCKMEERRRWEKRKRSPQWSMSLLSIHQPAAWSSWEAEPFGRFAGPTSPNGFDWSTRSFLWQSRQTGTDAPVHTMGVIIITKWNI